MRWVHVLVASVCLVSSEIDAQVLKHLPGIDDSEPQVIYDFILVQNGLGIKAYRDLNVPDRRFRSLTNYYDLGGWSAAQQVTGAISEMYHTDRWVAEFTPLGWDPLPYEIEGMAWIPSERLIACAWDDEQDVSILLEIDEQTGVFDSLATLPANLRFSGLAYSGAGLAGVSRDLKTNVSAVYVTDEEAWTAKYLVDLPAPCEALGSGYGYSWIAAGERVFNVIGKDVTEWTIYPEGEIGTIVALGDWFGFSAVEPATWGRIKQQFR